MRPRRDARELIAQIRGRALNEAELRATSLAVAESLLSDAQRETLPHERERAEVLARLMQDEAGQVLTTLLADRVYRSRDPARTVDAARQLLRSLGVPRYMPRAARLALTLLQRVGPFTPGLAAAGMLERLRAETAHVVLEASDPALAKYLAQRAAQGVRINANELGEAVLGEEEAQRRVDRYVGLLARPDIEAISVKVSSIYSQIDLLAWDKSVQTLLERLAPIYRAALAHRFRRGDSSQPKLVTLDMESYRDLHLTVAVFQEALTRPEFLGLRAGIVLQAYLPDSAVLQRQLTAFAQERVARGGAPLRLRIVKGANLLAERAEAASRGFPVPIYASKAEVDANFKKMVDFGCEPARARALGLGIASHNLFDIAFGLVLRASRGVENEVGFELLEGMADPLLRAVNAAAGDVLAYAPLCDARAMHTAIAYLLRRLDENTAEHNFLRSSFGLRVGDVAYVEQRARFEAALAARHTVDETPRRVAAARVVPSDPTQFRGEPDTDFVLAENREWIAKIVARWRARPTFELALGARDAPRDAGEAQWAEGFDPSRPGSIAYRYHLAGPAEIERAISTADAAFARASSVPLEARAALLREVAQALRVQRGELIGAMVLDAGKRIEQADTEVSEAIDFAEYYAATTLAFARAHPHLELVPSGPVLVTPPWNFPLAIPAGGVFAALMAGCSVILKPALETVCVADQLAQLCWDAGVPRDVLQLVVARDEHASALVRDARIARVLLTGATSTAQLFARMRPDIALSAETGGKNAIIVSALADRDDAIKDVLAAAFGHAGQKCSACSLLICEAEVYDDPAFMATLRDAAASLPVGPSWEPDAVVTPLIAAPRGPLLDALSQLGDGEQWLLAPTRDPRNPALVGPGIKLGVREGSPSHVTELFGPVLSVMRATDLEHAVRLANSTPYGLTAGLHSLDEHEQARFLERIEAGNVYVNRSITGAIVGRQPFGGWKASSFGPGAKAGGPNYVSHLMAPRERHAPPISAAPHPAAAELAVALRPQLSEAERERLGAGLCSYNDALRTHFALDHDPCAVQGERNVFRYLPCRSILLRAGPGSALVDVLLATSAALTASAAFTLSVDREFAERNARALALLPASVPFTTEDAGTLASRIAAPLERIRLIGREEPGVRAAANAASAHLETAPIYVTGRLELLHYHREQSISVRYHRHGNLAAARLLPPLRG